MSMTRRSVLGKPTAIDYVFMFGGPILFLAIAFWGILWVLGPVPAPNPITLIKKGEVKVGMSQGQVERVLGEPKSTEPQADGSVNWIYHHGTEEPYVEED